MRRTFRYSAASTSHSARMTMNDTATSIEVPQGKPQHVDGALAMNRNGRQDEAGRARTGAVRVYATSHTTIAT